MKSEKATSPTTVRGLERVGARSTTLEILANAIPAFGGALLENGLDRRPDLWNRNGEYALRALEAVAAVTGARVTLVRVLHNLVWASGSRARPRSPDERARRTEDHHRRSPQSCRHVRRTTIVAHEKPCSRKSSRKLTQARTFQPPNRCAGGTLHGVEYCRLVRTAGINGGDCSVML